MISLCMNVVPRRYLLVLLENSGRVDLDLAAHDKMLGYLKVVCFPSSVSAWFYYRDAVKKNPLHQNGTELF